jgi:hypothetical protein
MALEKLELKWSYKPTDYFEEPYTSTHRGYSLQIDNGEVTLFEEIHDCLNDVFLGAQLANHRPYQLSHYTLHSLGPGGIRIAFMHASSGGVSMVGAADIVSKDASGNVFSETRAQRVHHCSLPSTAEFGRPLWTEAHPHRVPVDLVDAQHRFALLRSFGHGDINCLGLLRRVHYDGACPRFLVPFPERDLVRLKDILQRLHGLRGNRLSSDLDLDRLPSPFQMLHLHLRLVFRGGHWNEWQTQNRLSLAELAARHRSKDSTAEAVLRSYGAAVNDPANELIHLYEVREALKKKLGKRACKELKITDTQWSRLGRLANDLPLRQGRHRGKLHAELRNATPDELRQARGIAQKMIVEYLKYLESCGL